MLATDGDSIPANVLDQVRDDVERAGLLGGAEDDVAAAMMILRDQAGAGWSALRMELREGVDEAMAEAGAFAGAFADSLQRRRLLEATRFGRQFGRRSPLGRGMSLLEAGRFDSAAVVFERILDEDAQTPAAWMGLEEAHVRLGHYAGAAEVRERQLGATHGDASVATDEIAALRATFDADDPASYWRWRRDYNARQLERGVRVPNVERATTAMGLGDHEAALEYLEAAVSSREPGLFALRTNPLWDPLRTQSRFRDITRSAWEIRGRDGTAMPQRGGPPPPRAGRR